MINNFKIKAFNLSQRLFELINKKFNNLLNKIRVIINFLIILYIYSKKLNY